MYQLEVKYHLIKYRFPPSDGWDVLVDIDAMEQAKGPQHKLGKKERVQIAENELLKLGARIGAHPKYGRVDVFAHHDTHGTHLLEVEGQSSKQKEQAMYSALGQSILGMNSSNNKLFFGVAFPDSIEWENQAIKVPNRIKKLLNLHCYLVSETAVRKI